jgi:hypothetical protein
MEADMPDRVVIVLTVWLTVFTGAGSLLGRYVLDIPGTLTVAGFLIAVVTTFLWPWIMPGPIDRWMDGGAAAERYDSWAEQGRNVVPGVRGFIDRSRTSMGEVRRLFNEHRRPDGRMDGGAAS